MRASASLSKISICHDLFVFTAEESKAARKHSFNCTDAEIRPHAAAMDAAAIVIFVQRGASILKAS